MYEKTVGYQVVRDFFQSAYFPEFYEREWKNIMLPKGSLAFTQVQIKCSDCTERQMWSMLPANVFKNHTANINSCQ